MNCIDQLKDNIQKVATKCDRDPSKIRFLVASKYFSVHQIQAFYDLGVRDFGENRVQDALEKIEALPDDIHWHFLGHLQSKKIPKIKGRFELIHSIDSLELAQKLSHSLVHSQKVLLQIKTTQEPTKTGMTRQEFEKDYPKLQKLDHLEIKGLMTLGPKDGTEEQVRTSFQTLAQLKAKYNPTWELSMGMSQDYPWAIEEGATLLRIGRMLKQS